MALAAALAVLALGSYTLARWRAVDAAATLESATPDASGARSSAAVSQTPRAHKPPAPAAGASSAPVAGGPATAAADIASPGRATRPATITVSAVGDMIFDRRVAELVRAEGGSAPLAHVAAHLKAADITVGNLESPLSSRGTRDADKDVTFRGDPRGIRGLADAGFDFLSLANNHVLDYGPVALADTIDALDERGIGYAGAGADRSAARKPAVRERRGASVAFLSFSHILPPGFIAGPERAGLAQGRGNMDGVAKAIGEAKAANDYVIVSFHWGVEYVDDANGDQVRDARRAIDAGADMVLNHHPHVIQGLEVYKDRLIAYSLGNFVFDHYKRKTGESIILDARLGPHGVADVRATPVYLDGYGRPKVVRGTEGQEILKRLKLISGRHGTSVTIEGDIARIVE